MMRMGRAQMQNEKQTSGSLRLHMLIRFDIQFIRFASCSYRSLNIDITAQNRNFCSKNGRRTQTTANFHIFFGERWFEVTAFAWLSTDKSAAKLNCRDHHASPIDQSFSAPAYVRCITLSRFWFKQMMHLKIVGFWIQCAPCSASFANKITEM